MTSDQKRWFAIGAICVVVLLLCFWAVQSLRSSYGEHAQEQEIITRAKTQLGVFENALDMFDLNHGYYPTVAQGGLDALRMCPRGIDRDDWAGPYLDGSLVDPWGCNYCYSPEVPEVWSAGPDRVNGTDDDVYP